MSELLLSQPCITADVMMNDTEDNSPRDIANQFKLARTNLRSKPASSPSSFFGHRLFSFGCCCACTAGVAGMMCRSLTVQCLGPLTDPFSLGDCMRRG